MRDPTCILAWWSVIKYLRRLPNLLYINGQNGVVQPPLGCLFFFFFLKKKIKKKIKKI